MDILEQAPGNGARIAVWLRTIAADRPVSSGARRSAHGNYDFARITRTRRRCEVSILLAPISLEAQDVIASPVAPCCREQPFPRRVRVMTSLAMAMAPVGVRRTRSISTPSLDDAIRAISHPGRCAILLSARVDPKKSAVKSHGLTTAATLWSAIPRTEKSDGATNSTRFRWTR